MVKVNHKQTVCNQKANAVILRNSLNSSVKFTEAVFAVCLRSAAAHLVERHFRLFAAPLVVTPSAEVPAQAQ